MLSILAFQPKLDLIFSTWFPLENSKVIFIIGSLLPCIIGVRGVGDSKGERQLLIVDGESEFDQNVFAICNNFKTEY